MGEAKKKRLNGGTSALTAPAVLVQTKRVRFVPNIRLENDSDSTLMILGDKEPELGVQLKPIEARKLADALVAHAAELESKQSRIIIPGAGLHAV